MHRKYISFELTVKEKFERASNEVKLNDYIEIHSCRGLNYGKITKINPNEIVINLEGHEKRFDWSDIDSITVVMP